MRAPRANMLRGSLALLLTLLCALAAGAQDSVTVLLLGTGSEQREAELTARIRGQTRDMTLQLRVHRQQAPITADGAGEQARASQAQIVVWTEATGPTGLKVRILDVASGELRARSVSTSEREALASSTMAEMAALVVRSELAALLAERAARARRPPPEPTPAPPPEPAPPPSAPMPVRPPHADASWLVALGYRPSLPIRDQLAHGVALAGRRELGKLVLGVVGQLAAPFTLSDPETRIRLRRGGLRAEALRALMLSARLRLLLGGAAGLTLTGRTTRAVRPPLQGAGGAITAGATLGLLTELHWQASRRLGVWLGAGVDGVLWRTKFAYESAAGRHQLGSLARFEPWLMLGFFARWPASAQGP